MNKQLNYLLILPLFLLSGIALFSCSYFGDVANLVSLRNRAESQPDERIFKTIVIDSQTRQRVGQASIEVNGEPADSITLTKAANDAGVFEIRLLTQRLENTPIVELSASAPGYLPGVVSLPGLAGQTSQEIEIVLEPTSIKGQIIDAWTGEPLPAVVRLRHEGQTVGLAEQIQANGTGHYHALRLEPPIMLQVEQPGYEPWQTELNSSELFTTQSVHEQMIELIPRTTVGRIQAADTGAPLPQVTLISGSGPRSQSVTTDSEGRFELHRLVPDDLIIIQAPDDYLSTELIYQNEPELSLALQPNRLTVTVLDQRFGQPISDTQVTLTGGITATTNSQGQITFSAVPTAGQVSLTRAGYQPERIDYHNQNSLEISLTPLAWQGTVRDRQTGQPLPKAILYLNDRMLQADENGYFLIENLPETPVPLLVKAAGYHRAYGQLSQTGLVTATTAPPFDGTEGQWLVTGPCAASSGLAGSPCNDLKLDRFYAKAIYIPFNYLRSREAMIGYLDFVQATELNAIVVDVKGDFGRIGWDSEVALAETVGAEVAQTENWLPLAELIAEAEKRNIYTIARFVVFKDDPLAHGQPDLAVVREDGSVWIDGEELGWANPFKEEVWEYNIALAEEVAAFGFDELNFDYIRFPSDGDLGAIVYEEENTRETRTAAIREFMQRLTEALRPYQVFTSADVFGLTIWVTPESDMSIGQRIIDIAPQVDYLAPMVYPATFIPGNLGYDNPSAEPYGVVFRSQEKAEELVPPHVKVRPWLQGYWYSLEEMRLLRQAALDSDAWGWAWWNAGGKYDSELFGPADRE